MSLRSGTRRREEGIMSKHPINESHIVLLAMVLAIVTYGAIIYIVVHE